MNQGHRKAQVGSFLLVTACFITISTVGFNSPVEGVVDTQEVSSEPPIFVSPVQAAPIRRGDMSSHFETTSRIEAQSRVAVLSKGAGLCLNVNAEVGDVVVQGQKLAALERDEFEAQIRQARITVQQHKTAFEIAERSFQEGIGASAERDNMRFAYEQACATLEMSEIKLRNQTIQSPIGGIITERIIQEGMVISPGIPLFTIVDPDSYTLPINVPEKELARLSVGQLAEVRIDAFPDRVFKACISRINPSIDPLSGTVRALLDFDKSDKVHLRDAAFTRVNLVMEVKSNVLLLPRDAILEEQGRKQVFLLEEVDKSTVDLGRFTGLDDRALYKVRRVEIRTGLEQSDIVEVTEGVSEKNLVVTLGQHTLKNDAYVTVTSLDQELTLRRSMTPQEALVSASTSNDLRISTDASGFPGSSF